MLYHNMARCVRQHTGRLIQVTVCELDGDFKLWAQARGAQRTIHRPEIEQRDPQHDTTTTTTPSIPLEPRGPYLGLGLLASPTVASFPCPGPRPISDEC